MRSRLSLALALVSALAESAGATDLELGLDVGAAYNSNLFGTATDPESDYSGRVGPRLRAMDEQGKFTWDVHYFPIYEKYLHIGEADGWDHDLDARATWTPSRRTQLVFVESFLDTGNVNQIFAQDGLSSEPIDTGFEFGRDRIRTNNASLALDHALAPRHNVNFAVRRADSRFERQAQSETEVTGASASYLYGWSPLDRVGLGLHVTQQEVTQREDLVGDRNPEPTNYYNLSLQWVRSFDPTLTLNASAGPTWVRQDTAELPRTQRVRRFFPVHASSCPRNGQGEIFLGEGCEPFTPEELGQGFGYPALQEFTDIDRRGGSPSSGESLTYFADISLTKDWRDLSLTLRYSRDASTTSELSGIVLDSLGAYLRWTPSSRWSVSFQAQYQRREQPTEGLEGQGLLEPATLVGTATIVNPDGSINTFTRTVPDFGESVGFRFITRERNVKIDDYTGAIFLNYQLNRSTRLYWQFSYQYEQVRDELERALFEESNWDRFYVAMGVTYTLPRFNLPF